MAVLLVRRVFGARPPPGGGRRGGGGAGKGRGRWHGGKRTGARRPLGFPPEARLAYKLAIAARGKGFGGRLPKIKPRLSREVLDMVDALIEILPAGPLEKPVEEWSAYELLSDGTRQALMRHREMAM